MTKVVCPNCQAKLKLPDGFDKPSAKCPRCGQRIDTGTRSPQETNHESQPGDAGKPVVEDSWVIDTGEKDSSGNSLTKNRSAWISGLLDFKFKTYLTPKIIGLSWVLVLVMSALWIVFLIFLFAVSLIPAADQTAASPHALNQPLDIDAILDGQGRALPGIGDLLGGSLGGTTQEPTFMQRVTGFGWRLLLFVTSLIGLVLTLLGCRVFLETIIVIFDISDCLKRIEAGDD